MDARGDAETRGRDRFERARGRRAGNDEGDFDDARRDVGTDENAMFDAQWNHVHCVRRDGIFGSIRDASRREERLAYDSSDSMR